MKDETNEGMKAGMPNVDENQCKVLAFQRENFKGDFPQTDDPRILEALQDSLRISPVLEKARVEEIVDVFDTCLTDKGNEIFLKINPLLVKHLIEFGCSNVAEVTMEDWRSLPWKSILSSQGFHSTPVEQLCNQVVFLAWTNFFDLPFKVKILPGQIQSISDPDGAEVKGKETGPIVVFDV